MIKLKKVIKFKNGAELYPYRLIIFLLAVTALCIWLSTMNFDAPKDYFLAFIQI